MEVGGWRWMLKGEIEDEKNGGWKWVEEKENKFRFRPFRPRH